MTNFAIIGKHPEISLQELKSIWISKITKLERSVILFNTKETKKLQKMGGVIKRWKEISKKNLPEIFTDKRVVWVNEEWLGKEFKKSFNLRKYKTLALFKSDREIKKKGVEILKIKNRLFLVEWYQNIPLYESIDFKKPSRDMQMWMMPAKLTNMLINIGLYKTQNAKNILIYDPFAWSGTTGFLANYFWYDFLASDIDISHLKKNLPRRQTTKYANKDKLIHSFTHDVTKDFPKEYFTSSKKFNKILIITEWRLWPIVTKETDRYTLEENQKEIFKIYSNFLINISRTVKPNTDLPTMAFTIPYYIKQKNTLSQDIQKITSKIWRKFDSIKEIYERPGQNVWRKIITLS